MNFVERIKEEARNIAQFESTKGLTPQLMRDIFGNTNGLGAQPFFGCTSSGQTGVTWGGGVFLPAGPPQIPDKG